MAKHSLTVRAPFPVLFAAIHSDGLPPSCQAAAGSEPHKLPAQNTATSKPAAPSKCRSQNRALRLTPFQRTTLSTST